MEEINFRKSFLLLIILYRKDFFLEKENAPAPKPKGMISDSVECVNLNRGLTGKEYQTVILAFDLAKKSILESLPEDVREKTAMTLFCHSKKQPNSFVNQMLKVARNIDVVLDATLSMRLIENNPSQAQELAESKNEMKSALRTLSNIVTNRFKLRSALYKNRQNKQNREKKQNRE